MLEVTGAEALVVAAGSGGAFSFPGAASPGIRVAVGLFSVNGMISIYNMYIYNTVIINNYNFK
jgi:hypothetical protein